MCDKDRGYVVQSIECCFRCKNCGVWNKLSGSSYHCNILVQASSIKLPAAQNMVSPLGKCSDFKPRD
jgi:hypothetical protein